MEKIDMKLLNNTAHAYFEVMAAEMIKEKEDLLPKNTDELAACLAGIGTAVFMRHAQLQDAIFDLYNRVNKLRKETNDHV